MANETTLVVRSDVSGAIAGMRRVSAGAKEMELSMGGFASTIQKNWLGVSAAVAAAASAIYKARQYMHDAMKAEQSEEAFRNVAEAYQFNADTALEAMDRLTNGTIEKSDLMQKAMKGISGGIDIADMLKIAEMARLAARRTGEDIGAAMSTIADSIETGRVKALRAYNLITPEQKKLVEAARDEGVEVNILKIAWLNYQIQLAAVGAPQENAIERYQRMKATIKELGETIGKYLIMALAYAASAVVGVAAKILWPIARIQELINKIPGVPKSDAWIKWEQDLKALSDKLTGEAAAGAGPVSAEGVANAKSELDNYMKYLRQFSGENKKLAQELERAEAALKSFSDQVAQSDPTISEYDKRMFQLENTAEKFKQQYKDFPQLFGEADRILSEGKGFVVLDMQLKQAKEAAEQFRRAYFARQDFERELTETTMGEIELRLAAEDKWLADMRNKSLEFVQSVEEFNAIDVRLTEITAQKKKEIWDGYFQDLLQKELDLLQKKDDAMKGLTMGAINQATSGMPGGQDVASLAAIGQGEDPYTKAIEKLNEYYVMRYALAETEAEEEVVLARWQAEQENIIQQQKMEMASNTFGMLAGMAMSFYNASGQQSKAAFTAYKAFSIAQTTIDTIKGAMAAYSAMAAIPIVGPALGAAAAAAVIAFGMARVAQIAAMQPGTSASVPKPPAHSASASAGKDKATTEATKVEERSQSVNVYIYGNVIDQDKFAREIIPAIAKAQGDRVQ